jgi:hypothetical protein
MVATPARIAFITQPYRKALTAVDPTVEAAYGELARATNADEPEETLFDSIADTQAIANERLALLSPERGRYQATLPDGLSFALTLDYSTASPTGTVIDPERGTDKPAIVTDITFDLRRGAAALSLWG